MVSVNLADYATPGQLAGTEDIVSAFTAAQNALPTPDGGKILVPSDAQCWWSGSSVVMLKSNIEIDFQGALGFKTTGDGYYCCFAALRVQDITIRNGIFRGLFSANVNICVLASNRSSNILVEDCEMIEAQTSAGHTFDFGGTSGMTFKRCIWRGFKTQYGVVSRAETVQLDMSIAGALSYPDTGNCDGSLCNDFWAEDCQLLPFTDDANRPRLVVIGDSLTYQSGAGRANLESEMAKRGIVPQDIYFYGVSGKKLIDPDTGGKTTFDNITEAVAQMGNVDQWIIALGTNDAGATSASITSRTQSILAAIPPGDPVSWIGVSYKTNTPGGSADKVNTAVQAGIDSRTTFCDWGAFIHDGRDETGLWLTTESTHMTAAGYKVRTEYYVNQIGSFPGTVQYPAPNLVGSHSYREDVQYENVTLINTKIVDPAIDSAGAAAYDGYIRGMLHFISIKNLLIDGLDINCSTPRTIRAIMIEGRLTGTLSSTDWNAAGTTGTYATPNICEDITIRNVSINGLRAGVGQNDIYNPVIVITGVTGGYNQNINVEGMITNCGGPASVQVSKGNNVSIDVALVNAPGIVIEDSTAVNITGSTQGAQAPITLTRTHDFHVKLFKAQLTGMAPAVIILNSSDYGVIEDVSWSGYVSLTNGDPPDNVVIITNSSTSPGRLFPFIFTVWTGSGPYDRRGRIERPYGISGSLKRNGPGSCTFTVDDDDERIEALVSDSARVTIDYYPEGATSAFRVLSGPLTPMESGGAYHAKTRTFTVVDDWSEIFNEVTGWPNPYGDGSQQGTDSAYYTSSGSASGVVRGIAWPNIQRLGLDANTIFDDQSGLGSNITVKIRMHSLAERLFPKVDQAGVMVQVLQQDDGMRHVLCSVPVTITSPLTEESGVVEVPEWSHGKPLKTRYVVGAGGEGTARFFKEYLHTDWETKYAMIREGFIDARDVEIADPNRDTILQQRANEQFLEDAPKDSLKAVLAETEDWAFMKTFNLGDVVRIVPEGVAREDYLEAPVSEVQFSVDDGSALVTITPLIGDWADSTEDEIVRIVAALSRAVRDQQRSL